MSRVKARSIGEVIERMRALHVDAMARSDRPAESGTPWLGSELDPEIKFCAEAHLEMDLLMIDAFEILGQHEIVAVRKVVDKSYGGFWYA